MELISLGFDSWFQEKFKACTGTDYRPARVTAVDKDSCRITGEAGEMIASLEGRFRYQAESSLDFPATGDWVCVTCHNDNTLAIIHAILPRKSLLKRKTAGKKTDYQLIAANIDTAFIIQAADTDYNIRRLERYLIAVRESSINPVILLSKTDLVSPEELNKKLAYISIYSKTYSTLSFSNTTGMGLDTVKNTIKQGQTYCLIGSSGVGKTTLLNRLIGDDTYTTGEVRQWDGKGKHITSRRQLTPLAEGGLIIDTPGLRELGNIEIETGITEIFPDIEALIAQCRYSNCTHTSEPGCAVLEALKNGSLKQDRFKSYEKLRKESEYNKMTYLEKRQKDKAFGKFVKSVINQRKKTRW